jgi:hypothetical protein
MACLPVCSYFQTLKISHQRKISNQPTGSLPTISATVFELATNLADVFQERFCREIKKEWVLYVVSF